MNLDPSLEAESRSDSIPTSYVYNNMVKYTSKKNKMKESLPLNLEARKNKTLNQ